MSMLPGLSARVERYEQRIKDLNDGMKSLERAGAKTLGEHRTKHCSRCDDTKPLTAFAKCSSSKDGHQWWCRACYSTYLADRAARRAERLKALARDRERAKLYSDLQLLSNQQDELAPIKGMVLGVLVGLSIWVIIVLLVLGVVL